MILKTIILTLLYVTLYLIIGLFLGIGVTWFCVKVWNWNEGKMNGGAILVALVGILWPVIIPLFFSCLIFYYMIIISEKIVKNVFNWR